MISTACLDPVWRLEEVARTDPHKVLLIDRVKEHLRIDHSHDDLWVQRNVKVVVLMAERELNRTLVNTDWRYLADAFPTDGGAIDLPYPPIQIVTEVAYRTGGTFVVLVEDADYTVDIGGMFGARLTPVEGGAWPVPEQGPSVVRVVYTAGYADPNDIPATHIAWMLAQTGSLYANRESVVPGQQPRVVPGMDRLLTDQVPFLA